MKSIVPALLIGASASALSQVPEDLIRLLSRCDGHFFKVLADRKAQLSALAPMDTEKGHGYFKVANQRHPTDSRVMFARPLEVAGIKLVGYFDEIINIPDQAIIYSWGFLAAPGVRQAAAAWRSLTWDAARLRELEGAFVRSEVWTEARKEQGWAQVTTQPGVPKPGTVERVLLIEPYDGETTFIRYGCSIQGSVTTEMLRDIRPDLGQ